MSHTSSRPVDWEKLVTDNQNRLYRAALADPATKSGTRITCYFGKSQVQPIPAGA